MYFVVNFFITYGELFVYPKLFYLLVINTKLILFIFFTNPRFLVVYFLEFYDPLGLTYEVLGIKIG